MRVIGNVPIGQGAPLFRNFTSMDHHWPMYDFLKAVQKICPNLRYINFSGDVDLPQGLEDVDQSDYLHPMMRLEWGNESQDCMKVELYRFNAPQDKYTELFRAVCDTVFVCPTIPSLTEGTGSFFDEECMIALFPKKDIRFREVDRFKYNTAEIITCSNSRESTEKIDFHYWFYTNDKHYTRIWLRGVEGQKRLASWIKKVIPSSMIFGTDFSWKGFDVEDCKPIDLTDKDRNKRRAFLRKMKPYREVIMPYLRYRGLDPKSLGASYIFDASEVLYKRGITNYRLNALLAIAVGRCSVMAFTMCMMPRLGSSEILQRKEEDAIGYELEEDYDRIKPSLTERLVATWYVRKPLLGKDATLEIVRAAFRSYLADDKNLAEYNTAFERGSLLTR